MEAHWIALLALAFLTIFLGLQSLHLINKQHALEGRLRRTMRHLNLGWDLQSQHRED